MATAYADYFAMKNEPQGYTAWGSWTSPYPDGLPILHYANMDEHSVHYPLASPISDFSSHDGISPTMHSPTNFCFTSNISNSMPTPTVTNPSPTDLENMPSLENTESDDDDDSSSYSPRQIISSSPQHSRVMKSTAVPRHTRTPSAGSWTLAKRAHNIVERNYRDRLNSKISELSRYLFEGSADSRAKPSKSVVIARAKERLTQLESHNRELVAEVTKLRQQLAIQNHVTRHGSV